MSKVPSRGDAHHEPEGSSEEAGLRDRVEALTVEVERLRNWIQRVDVGIRHEVRTERLVVVGEQGVVTIGQLSKEATGLRVEGRGDCLHTNATVCVDNGRQNMDPIPAAAITAGSDSGYVLVTAPNAPMATPHISIEADRPRAEGIQLGHRFDGYIEEVDDINGVWVGALELGCGDRPERALITYCELDEINERRPWVRVDQHGKVVVP